ncbi:MAG: hypothetical protein JO270_15630 [Acidobacteriaceae bacterium]|nr:hypothetical protein [Acidobacteriaceae bacterium]MBV8570828.1 hypothetical protein [Acidobacteriaceae bacterium]
MYPQYRRSRRRHNTLVDQTLLSKDFRERVAAGRALTAAIVKFLVTDGWWIHRPDGLRQRRLHDTLAGLERQSAIQYEGVVRTLVAIICGLIGAFAFVFVSRSLGKGIIPGALIFIVGWLIFCGIDYFHGVKAGYSALDELGIHLVLFMIPAFAAWLAARLLA